MVDLNAYDTFWQNAAAAIPGIKSVIPITVETDLKDILQGLKKDDQPFLAVLTPSSDGVGEYDNDKERNDCIIYLMMKHDPQMKLTDTRKIQADLLPISEQLKQVIKEAAATGCTIIHDVDYRSIHTDAERKMFSVLSGWSISFSFISVP